MVITMMGINDDRDDLIYEYNTDGIKSFIYSIKVYKLARLLRLHIISSSNTTKNKIKERLSFINSDWGKKPSKDNKGSNTKTVKVKPGNEWEYTRLGDDYSKAGKYREAETMYGKAMRINPNNDIVYINFGNCYLEECKFKEAESMYKKATEVNPKNEWGYTILGLYYTRAGRYPEAETMYRKAVERNPTSLTALTTLAQFYKIQNRYSEAENIYNKIIALYPQDENAYYSLNYIYKKEGNENRMIEILNKHVRASGGIFSLRHLNKINYINSKYFGLATIHNYQKLCKVLNKRGTKYVCVQYPTRSVKDLRRILSSYKNIIYVDNEKVFNESIAKDGYDSYFVDKFTETLGHCTAKGNRLLAKNIAGTITKEVFNK
ncbi:MAG: tetratricopeptide repeat protein [Elusimicrobia bacterium]|nr:tetratricopeptide repeat protein [Candidatus Liberimonas magnetica]